MPRGPQLNRKGGIIPHDESGMLMNIHRMRDYIKGAEPQARQKLIAFLSTVYTGMQLTEMFDLKKAYVGFCRKGHPEIVESAMLSRNYAISDMTERKTIELLQKLEVDNIADDKKPRAIKDLMDSGVVAHNKVKPKEEHREDDTLELVFRVKSKMKRDPIIDAQVVEEIEDGK